MGLTWYKINKRDLSGTTSLSGTKATKRDLQQNQQKGN